MRKNVTLALLFISACAGLAAGGCSKSEAPAPAAPAADVKPATPADGGKIPISTSSPEAKAEFLKGRDIVDKLRLTDSVSYFQKAVSLDPHFAWAELSLANTAPTGTEFFDHLHKAVALADGASNGERLLILATAAGANNDQAKQKEYSEQLVAAYPNDERAHFQLGGYYFGVQDYPNAIEQYRKATEVAPDYSAGYNLLGYAYRQAGDYGNAEKAFQKYIELIPNDPNPYDSYAELLLKMGRFDDSIVQYRKALEIDPNFVNAHQGIAMALLYSGKPGEAAAELQAFLQKARTDAERRTALFGLTVVSVDGGKFGKALEEVEKQYALGQKTNDVGAMAFDRGLKGMILLEMGKPGEAQAAFEEGARLVEASNLSDELKANARLVNHYNMARVAAAKKDFAKAKSEAEEYGRGADASKNPNQMRNAHEIVGIVALSQKDYDTAIAELSQANAQNSQNLYRLCLAYRGKGDAAKAKESCTKAAESNTLPSLNFALVRTRAKAAAAKG